MNVSSVDLRRELRAVWVMVEQSVQRGRRARLDGGDRHLESRPQHRVVQIGARFGEAGDAVAVGDRPRAFNWGKMNHIQWLRFRPSRNS